MTMEGTFLLFLLEITAKATTVVGLAGLACWMLRHASAAVRHFVWMAAIAGIMVLPALRVVAPPWSVSVPALTSRPAEPPAAEAASPISRAQAPLAAKPGPEARTRRVAVDRPTTSRAVTGPTMSASPDLTTSPARPLERSDEQPITRSVARQVSLPVIVLILWCAGAAIALCRFVAGHFRLWRIQRHTDPITDPVWLDLSRRVAHQLHLSVAVRLLRCRRPTMPVCWGVRRPSLLLPADADAWTVERRRIVLLHELAHAKRGDCLTQAIAQLAVALYWFNPLVWLAVRRLRMERERACDDLVLAAGASAPDYADHLLEIARRFRTVGCPSWAAVAMARPSQLEGRLLAILDRHRDRRTLTRRACAAAAAFAFATVGALAAVQPVPAPAATSPRASSQAVSKGRPQPAPADASETAAESRVTIARQPVPAPAARPVVVPKADLESPELDDVEFGLATVEPIALAGAQGAPPPPAISKRGRGDDRPEADPRIVAALTTALMDPSVDVRRQAAMTLSQLRSAQAIDALIAATTDADKEVRQFAVHAISRHESDAVTKALVRALKDSSADVRQQAAHALGEIGDVRAIDPLIAAMKDVNADVREQIVYALGRIGQRSVRAEKGRR